MGHAAAHLTRIERARLTDLVADGHALSVFALCEAYEAAYADRLDLDALVEWVTAKRAALPAREDRQVAVSPAAPQGAALPQQLAASLPLEDAALCSELDRIAAGRDPLELNPTTLIEELEAAGWSFNEYRVHAWLYEARAAAELDEALGRPLGEHHAPRLPRLEDSVLVAFDDAVAELGAAADDSKLLRGLAERGIELAPAELKRLWRAYRRRERRAQQNPRLAVRESRLGKLAELPSGLAKEQRDHGMLLLPVEFTRVASVFAPTRSRGRPVVRTFDLERLSNGSAEHSPLTTTHLRDLLAILASEGRQRFSPRTGDIVIDTSFHALHRAIHDSAIGGSSLVRLRRSLEALRTRPITVAQRPDPRASFGADRAEPLIRDWYELNEAVTGRGRALRVVLSGYWFGELAKPQPDKSAEQPRTVRALNWRAFRTLTRSSARLLWFQAEHQLRRRDYRDEPAKLLYENIPERIGLAADTESLKQTLLELRRQSGCDATQVAEIEAAEAALLRQYAMRVEKSWLESHLEGVVQLQGMRLSPDAKPLSLWVRQGDSPMLVMVENASMPPRDGELYQSVWAYPAFARARELWLDRQKRRPPPPG